MKNKMYYKIGDLCKVLKLTPRTIRHYDNIGLLPNTKRSDGYTRLFDEEDIKRLKEIIKLKKLKKLSLENIKKTFDSQNNNPTELIIITDSKSTCKTSNEIVKIIPFESEKSFFLNIEKAYKENNQKTKKIISIHQNKDVFLSQEGQKIFDKITKKNNIALVYAGIGLGTGLIIDYIVSKHKKILFSKQESKDIEKKSTALEQYGLISNIDFHIKTDQTKTIFFRKISNLFPIFTKKLNSDLKINHCFNTLEESLLYLTDVTIEAMVNRLNYAYKILIGYSTDKKIAQTFSATISTHYPNTKIETLALNTENKLLFGPNALIINII